MAFVKTTEGPSIAGRIVRGVAGAIEGAAKGMDWAQNYEFNKKKAAEADLHMQQMQQQMEQQRQKGEEVATQQWGDFLVNMSQAKNPEQFLNVNAQRAGQLLKYVPGASQMNQEQIIDYAKHMQANLQEPMMQYAKAKAIMMDLGATDKQVNDAYVMGDQAVSQVKAASPYETYPTWDAKKNVLDQLRSQRFAGEIAIKTADKKAEAANKPNKREDRLTREQILRTVQTFEASADIKPLKETLTSATKAEKLLNQKNLSNAVEPVKIMLAAAFNQGRPTDKDAEAMAQNPSVMNAIERFTSKKGLNVNIEEDRAQFKILAGALVTWAQERYQTRVREWAAGTAGLLNLGEQELADIVLQRGGYKTGPAASASGPKAGDVVDGYKFNGGDPAQSASWSKVK